MPAFRGKCLRPEIRPENFGKDTRYLDYWRVYVYLNKLHSMPKRNVRGFRNMNPSAYRTNYAERERMMMFANRDLSVLLFNKKSDLVNMREEIFPNLLIECNMKSLEFRFALAPFLGDNTNHFVSELINYARSPYNDPFCYELNVMYRSDVPVDGAVLHSFVDFSKRIDVDEFESDTLTDNPFYDIDDLGDEFPLLSDEPLLDLPNMQVNAEQQTSIGTSELTRMLNTGAAVRAAAAAQVAQAQAAAAANGGSVVATTGVATGLTAGGDTALAHAQLLQAQTAAVLAARRFAQQQQRLTSIANINNNIRLARKRERRQMKLNNAQRQQ